MTPALRKRPPSVGSHGHRAIELSEAAGRVVLPWQRGAVVDIQAVREDGKWSAREACVLASRQNGKSAVIETVELDWMLSEPGIPILHTAHEHKTAMKSLNKLEALLKGLPGAGGEPGRRNAFIKAVKRAHGEEAIILHNGSVCEFATRTGAAGRGTSYERLVVDEAMIYTPDSQAALHPLVNTASNGQIVYAGSAANADRQAYCHIWASLYWRARRDNPDDPLCFLGWVCDEDADPDDPREWAKSNPSAGTFLLDFETLAAARRSMMANPAAWRVEFMSIGVWPPEAEAPRKRVIDMGVWAAMVEANATVTGPVALAVDMDGDRKWLTIGAATGTADDKTRLEIGHHSVPGPEATRALVDLVRRWNPCVLVMSSTSPAKSLLPDLLKEGVEPELMTSGQMAAAFGMFYDAALHKQLSHAGDALLGDALEGAQTRTVAGGGKVWDYGSDVVMPPLLVATEALWALRQFGHLPAPLPAAAPSFGASGQSDDHHSPATDLDLDVFAAAF